MSREAENAGGPAREIAEICAGCGLVQGVGWLGRTGEVTQADPFPRDEFSAYDFVDTDGAIRRTADRYCSRECFRFVQGGCLDAEAEARGAEVAEWWRRMPAEDRRRIEQLKQHFDRILADYPAPGAG